MALTIRPRPDQEELIEKLKSQLGLSSSSKAILMAASIVVNEHPGLIKKIQKLETELEIAESKHMILINDLRDKERIEKRIKSAITSIYGSASRELPEQEV